MLTIPDQLLSTLALAGPQRERRALEMLALEGYREGKLSRGQVSEMLELGFFETEELLRKYGATDGTTMEELERSSHGLRSLLDR